MEKLEELQKEHDKLIEERKEELSQYVRYGSSLPKRIQRTMLSKLNSIDRRLTLVKYEMKLLEKGDNNEGKEC